MTAGHFPWQNIKSTPTSDLETKDAVMYLNSEEEEETSSEHKHFPDINHT